MGCELPGSIRGSTELEALHGEEVLTVPGNDPLGEEVSPCRECGGAFEGDWPDGTLTCNAFEE